VPANKILEAARAEKADVIGLSGLITPSLDEMVNVAREMEREGFTLPLLIGGATTSKVHTAVKIEPNYHGATVHVLDASRSVGVVTNLLSPEKKADFARDVKAEYGRVRKSYAGREPQSRLLSIADARAHRLQLSWNGRSDGQTVGRSTAPVPKRVGITEFSDYSL